MFTYKQIRKIHRGKKIFYELTAKGKKDLVKAKEELTKSSFTKKLIKKIRGI
jgi:DNA-binding PadR family transcriptional regulator